MLKHLSARWLIARLSLVLLTLPAHAAVEPPLEARIHGVLRERVDREKSIGIVVGLVDGGGATVVGYGKLGRDDDRRPAGDTVFEIGSVTKVFTSLVLADMVERGELALDDPVAKYLPESVKVPSRDGKQITLLHLATHTSGLPRLPGNLAPSNPGNPYADYSVEQMYEFLSAHDLTRQVGGSAEYSNLGVGLLGHVLARKAGMDYEKLVQARITGPLEMRDTVIQLTPEQRARLAGGHDRQLRPVPNWDFPTLAGAGALRSTANDMLKFVAANLGLTESKLSPAMESTHRARHEYGGPKAQIGLGWILRKERDGEILWHNGETGGYHSFIGMDKKKRTGVVVLSNSSNSIDDIGFHLIDEESAPAELKPPRQAVEVDAKIYEAYRGDYRLSPDFVMTVTREGDRLFVQATGQERIEVFPESESKFFAKAVDAQISFVKAPDGRIDHLILHQGGLDQRAKRVGEDGRSEFGPAQSRVLPSEVLDRYVGKYELQPGFVITVTRDGERLLAQATGQPAAEIFAQSQTEFFFKTVDARITFQVGAEGKATSLTLHQGGKDLPAPRVD